MSVEAVYSVLFYVAKTQMGGGGIIVLETGRVLGGDQSFLYLGDYQASGGKFKARVKVSKYQDVGMSNITGLDNYTGIFEGTYTDKEIIANGYVEGHPDILLEGLLTRRAELP